MSLLDTLIHPDREEDPERTLVAQAANLLQTGEFQVLQLAYFDFYGREMSKDTIAKVFRGYMFAGQVPSWAQNYALRIIALEARGELDDLDYAYHRYDSDFRTYVPDGVRLFTIMAMVLVIVVGGAIGFGHMAAHSGSTSVLPPYFSPEEIERTRR